MRHFSAYYLFFFPIFQQAIGIISLMFIVMSVMSLFFHSMLLIRPNKLFELLLFILDIITFTWFTLEFLLRFLSSPKRLAFITSMTNIVDLLCIITYPIQFSYGFQYYRERNEPIEVLAAVRLLRLFRFLRLSLGLQILKHALLASSKELFLLILLLIIPVAIFATLTYYIERKVCVIVICKAPFILEQNFSEVNLIYFEVDPINGRVKLARQFIKSSEEEDENNGSVMFFVTIN